MFNYPEDDWSSLDNVDVESRSRKGSSKQEKNRKKKAGYNKNDIVAQRRQERKDARMDARNQLKNRRKFSNNRRYKCKC